MCITPHQLIIDLSDLTEFLIVRNEINHAAILSNKKIDKLTVKM